MYMPDHGILGMRLRAQDRDNAEALFFRRRRIATLLPIAYSTCPWSMERSSGTYFPSIKHQRQFRLQAGTTSGLWSRGGKCVYT